MSERPTTISEAVTVVMLALAKLGVRDDAVEEMTKDLVHERWLSGKPSICMALNEPVILEGPPFALYYRWVPGLNEIPRLRTKAIHITHLSEEERQIWIKSDDDISNVPIRPIDGREIRCAPGDYIVFDRDGEVSDVLPGLHKFRSHFVPIDNSFIKAVFAFAESTGAVLDVE